ncbi:AFR105Cp [Eremothecium gossypii ATCC 10895]|uniref:Actin-related protein 4 n=1 Tax=Eremothecium gossypii (strain ATCC 10895 / CBS 109.51 / FGSC 9923 / NRRL Y-1056) TaxID=284811 RepID=ARP4_EREGS|nr:AFR105Cp [Eremothecium gossypii ATCC 10895]Q754G5.1 RecName: Full=Actin-related protein 4; AltName: Full=Actin-like protein ARP4; Short=Actin-like protein 4 [Eremothecium gossypii ATCC 10895]AAS53476.1 AFR105Cp [Eremothecium gossypii ATCC 10895]AEY97788.1 FAFR105Cp [Eremothecium gossypii FDAG1]
MSNSALQVYGGDEITAVVIDPGSFTTNIGYSGTDCPQAILPSCYGKYTEGEKDELFSEQSIGLPRKDYEIHNIVQNGEVVDWEKAEKQWDWAIRSELRFETNSGMPALLTEPIWNSEENRKKSLEVLLESMDFSACYLVPTATAVSFAMGRPTCLVVDIGHDVTSVCPVVDGMTLSKSSMRSYIAGSLLNELIRSQLAPRKVIPLFQVAQRRPVFMERKFDYEIHPSLQKFVNERQFFQEFKETMLQVAPTSISKFKSEIETTSKRSIEAPWGEELVYDSLQRLEFAEQLFTPDLSQFPEDWPISKDGVVETWHNDYVPLKRNKPGTNVKDKEGTLDATPVPDENSVTSADQPNDNGKRNLEETTPDQKNEVSGLADLIYSSIMSTDVDLRTTLSHNVVITGGTSSLPGLMDRISAELNRSLPALKFRMLTSGQLRERQYQGWLGGSILASLGTFHQLWVGKQEYAEVGADRLLKDRFR